MDWEPPRCSHGSIILACPELNCVEQNAYLDDLNRKIEDWHQRNEDAARAIVKAVLR